jgi:hypothetical protein
MSIHTWVHISILNLLEGKHFSRSKALRRNSRRQDVGKEPTDVGMEHRVTAASSLIIRLTDPDKAGRNRPHSLVSAVGRFPMPQENAFDMPSANVARKKGGRRRA